jgi:hypothetical protein
MVRIKIGKTELNGFFPISSGDIFEMPDGERAILTRGSYGWTLRRIEDGKPDYSSSAFEGWIDIPDAPAFIRKVNEEFQD